MGADIHSHLVPGVDDGAKTVNEAMRLLQHLAELGYQKVITTPHVASDYYPNTPQSIRTAFQALQAALAHDKLDIQVSIAAEYYADDHFEKLLASEDEILAFHGKHVLIESSMLSPIANLPKVIHQLLARDFQPILAHPERYLYYQKQPDQFSRFKAMGCQLQVNLLSLAGYYGRDQKKLGIQLLEMGLVDYLGTDLHQESQVKYLHKVLKDKEVMQLLEKLSFRNINLMA